MMEPELKETTWKGNRLVFKHSKNDCFSLEVVLDVRSPISTKLGETRKYVF